MALPSYEVEFIPLERRMGERRVASRGAPLPSGLSHDRRQEWDRRDVKNALSGTAANAENLGIPNPLITLVAL